MDLDGLLSRVVRLYRQDCGQFRETVEISKRSWYSQPSLAPLAKQTWIQFACC